jgi:hypothetical protein
LCGLRVMLDVLMALMIMISTGVILVRSGGRWMMVRRVTDRGIACCVHLDVAGDMVRLLLGNIFERTKDLRTDRLSTR